MSSTSARFSKFFLFGVVGLSLALLYNNCSQFSATATGGAELGSSSFAKNLCNEDPSALFSYTYQSFLATNCASCHANGPGKGGFANSNIGLAYQDFMTAGVDKINVNAASTGHAPPYSGTQNAPAIDDLKKLWAVGQEELAKCGKATIDESMANRIELVEKVISSSNTPAGAVVINPATSNNRAFKTLRWTLPSDLASSGSATNVAPVTIQVNVELNTAANGATFYRFTNLQVLRRNFDVQIRDVRVRINGVAIPRDTTWAFVDKGAFKEEDVFLSAVPLPAYAPISANDRISLSIAAIEEKVLPRPDPLSRLRFELATVSPANRKGSVVIKTQLVDANSGALKPAAGPVAVNLQIEGATSTAKGPSNLVNGRIESNFDWDFKISEVSRVILANESEASFTIQLSDNQRHQPTEEIIEISISSVDGAVIDDARKVVRIRLPAQIVINNTGALAFSQLMNRTTGILGTSCTFCHNSFDRQGGYDITDYEDMKLRRIINDTKYRVNASGIFETDASGSLIPDPAGKIDPHQSKMYFRMVPTDRNGNPHGLLPMPFAAPPNFPNYLPEDERIEVKKWIEAGSLNN